MKKTLIFLLAFLSIFFLAYSVLALNQTAPCGVDNQGNPCPCIDQPGPGYANCNVTPIYSNGCLSSYNVSSCSGGPVCGNGYCEGEGEQQNCPQDCGTNQTTNQTICGGFAGIRCPEGYYCDYQGRDKTANDARGICVKNQTQTCPQTGLRKSGTYCSIQQFWQQQKNQASSCENSFECKSNVCANNECVSGSLIQRIIEWFKRLFGG